MATGDEGLRIEVVYGDGHVARLKPDHAGLVTDIVVVDNLGQRTIVTPEHFPRLATVPRFNPDRGPGPDDYWDIRATYYTHRGVTSPARYHEETVRGHAAIIGQVCNALQAPVDVTDIVLRRRGGARDGN